MWDENLLEPLANELKDYPLRQLLTVLKELDQKQQDRIEQLKGEWEVKPGVHLNGKIKVRLKVDNTNYTNYNNNR